MVDDLPGPGSRPGPECGQPWITVTPSERGKTGLCHSSPPSHPLSPSHRDRPTPNRCTDAQRGSLPWGFPTKTSVCCGGATRPSVRSSAGRPRVVLKFKGRWGVPVRCLASSAGTPLPNATHSSDESWWPAIPTAGLAGRAWAGGRPRPADIQALPQPGRLLHRAETGTRRGLCQGETGPQRCGRGKGEGGGTGGGPPVCCSGVRSCGRVAWGDGMCWACKCWVWAGRPRYAPRPRAELSCRMPPATTVHSGGPRHAVPDTGHATVHF